MVEPTAEYVATPVILMFAARTILETADGVAARDHKELQENELASCPIGLCSDDFSHEAAKSAKRGKGGYSLAWLP